MLLQAGGTEVWLLCCSMSVGAADIPPASCVLSAGRGSVAAGVLVLLEGLTAASDSSGAVLVISGCLLNSFGIPVNSDRGPFLQLWPCPECVWSSGQFS